MEIDEVLEQEQGICSETLLQDALEGVLRLRVPLRGSAKSAAGEAPEPRAELLRAVLSGAEDKARRLLLEEEASPLFRVRGDSLLHFAVAADARRSGAGMTRLGLEAGADPEARDSLGRTPLHGAVLLDAPEAAEALLLLGDAEDLGKVRDVLGETPLELARRIGRTRLLPALEGRSQER